MCGIAGFLDASGKRSPDQNRRLAAAMADAVRHRGPDAGGIWSDGDMLWLSHGRLSIIDLSEAGAQPMGTPDGRGFIS